MTSLADLANFLALLPGSKVKALFAFPDTWIAELFGLDHKIVWGYRQKRGFPPLRRGGRHEGKQVFLAEWQPSLHFYMGIWRDMKALEIDRGRRKLHYYQASTLIREMDSADEVGDAEGWTALRDQLATLVSTLEAPGGEGLGQADGN